MNERRKGIAISLVTAGTIAAAIGYLFRTGISKTKASNVKANVGARVVNEVPRGAIAVDISSQRLHQLPGVRNAIQRAIQYDAKEQWEHVTLETEHAWDIVDSIRESLPYHESPGAEYNGVYVKCGDSVVVLDAIGWTQLEDQLQ